MSSLENGTRGRVKSEQQTHHSRGKHRQSTSEEELEQGGPATEPAQLHILTKDYVKGKTGVDISKQIQLSSKASTVKGAQQLEAVNIETNQSRPTKTMHKPSTETTLTPTNIDATQQ